MTDDLELPEDTRKSRLDKPAKAEKPDELATAEDRIKAFWRKHEGGRILTEVETVRESLDGSLTYTVAAAVFKIAEDSKPDATAHATRSSSDVNEIVAAYPQETAETVAISRAIRYLGIEPPKRRAKAAT